MSLLSVLHLALNCLALLLGGAILAMRKGTTKHRVLGWLYVALMLIGLSAILVKTLSRPAPFAGYAIFIVLVLFAAIASSRFRRAVYAWRSWHAGLMLLTFLGSTMAAASILAGAAAGALAGPIFYRLFNAIIALFTAVSLAVIWRSRTVWGVQPRPDETLARRRYSFIVAVSSLLLVLAQWPLAFPES